jgi:hypothetical protein
VPIPFHKEQSLDHCEIVYNRKRAKEEKTILTLSQLSYLSKTCNHSPYCPKISLDVAQKKITKRCKGRKPEYGLDS